MDTRETVTDGISSTTTGSDAMITDEGARTDRYISVCHTLIIFLIIIIIILLVRAHLYYLMVYQLILSIRYNNWKR